MTATLDDDLDLIPRTEVAVTADQLRRLCRFMDIGNAKLGAPIATGEPPLGGRRPIGNQIHLHLTATVPFTHTPKPEPRQSPRAIRLKAREVCIASNGVFVAACRAPTDAEGSVSGQSMSMYRWYSIEDVGAIEVGL